MPFFGLFQLPLRGRRQAESLAPRKAASAPPPPFFRSQKSQPQFPLISLTYNFEFQTPSLWPAIVGSHESLLSQPNWLCSFPAANSPPQPKEESPVTENRLRLVKSQLWDRPPGQAILAGLAARRPPTARPPSHLRNWLRFVKRLPVTFPTQRRIASYRELASFGQIATVGTGLLAGPPGLSSRHQSGAGAFACQPRAQQDMGLAGASAQCRLNKPWPRHKY